MENFPQLLKQLRKRQHLSQRMLSELCGFSHSTVSLYENGKVVPTALALIALSDFFECSIDFLLGR